IEAIAAQARPDSEPPAMRRTGEHEVVDDGNHTTIMDSMDPSSLGFDLASLGSAVPASTDPATDRSDTVSDDGDGDDAEVTDPGDPGQPGDTLEDNPPQQPGGGGRKRKLRR